MLAISQLSFREGCDEHPTRNLHLPFRVPHPSRFPRRVGIWPSTHQLVIPNPAAPPAAPAADQKNGADGGEGPAFRFAFLECGGCRNNTFVILRSRFAATKNLHSPFWLPHPSRLRRRVGIRPAAHQLVIPNPAALSADGGEEPAFALLECGGPLCGFRRSRNSTPLCRNTRVLRALFLRPSPTRDLFPGSQLTK